MGWKKGGSGKEGTHQGSDALATGSAAAAAAAETFVNKIRNQHLASYHMIFLIISGRSHYHIWEDSQHWGKTIVRFYFLKNVLSLNIYACVAQVSNPILCTLAPR